MRYAIGAPTVVLEVRNRGVGENAGNFLLFKLRSRALICRDSRAENGGDNGPLLGARHSHSRDCID